MAIELHPGHDDELSQLKVRIAELETLNHDLCERVTENDEIRLHWEEIEQTRAENERMKARIAELEEERRWRKFSEEKPKEKQWILVFVENPSKYGTYIELRRWDNGCKYDVEVQEIYDKWMTLPSDPKEEK